MLHAVITTVQIPTDSAKNLARALSGNRGRLVVAGDTKGPATYVLDDIDGFMQEQLAFLSIDAQLETGFQLAELLPTKHYARKNIGYLYAMRAGATCIYETDDDNAPLESWRPRDEYLQPPLVLRAKPGERPRWVNVYRHFSSENIWPRGLPLDRIHSGFESADDFNPAANDQQQVWAPIQQGLADGSPDVDAIWRLTMDREFRFESKPSVILPPGQWCPFNTQSTWWWPTVYPLLYIPSYCSFRMCDIWKSFVAQRCLWELGTGVVFHAPEVWQERNFHDLMRDFNDEIPGYQHNHRIAGFLDHVDLKRGAEFVSENLRTCYLRLIDTGIFPEAELELVEAWLADVAATRPKMSLTK